MAGYSSGGGMGVEEEDAQMKAKEIYNRILKTDSLSQLISAHIASTGANSDNNHNLSGGEGAGSNATRVHSTPHVSIYMPEAKNTSTTTTTTTSKPTTTAATPTPKAAARTTTADKSTLAVSPQPESLKNMKSPSSSEGVPQSMREIYSLSNQNKNKQNTTKHKRETPLDDSASHASKIQKTHTHSTPGGHVKKKSEKKSKSSDGTQLGTPELMRKIGWVKDGGTEKFQAFDYTTAQQQKQQQQHHVDEANMPYDPNRSIGDSLVKKKGGKLGPKRLGAKHRKGK